MNKKNQEHSRMDNRNQEEFAFETGDFNAQQILALMEEMKKSKKKK
ncbi:hypothetical protein GFC29_136 [Anoxybacillus sp. B7M1]|jgi:hypothetical protein|uniref:DNA-binding protein n=1 Tax=Anoxybacteroides rupiense TaxID=311460 RepID=A0ABD5IZ47_9BACL|nr:MULTISPECIES: hypothetical protein [Anoxybacillus]ANB56838.1 hypothetical protein GFC28_1492 [Anoxybacillus sp. B2M1]ANB64066.1 hypothetical protein GFC29_136 [Anoxybacillus sp. B7M1]KXG10293.1 hypothetical protein AT864_00884 [Anoxybacillus sp. P3H1B]MED5053498.1 hypothetical protein [Anoxybacillus rupiensis]